MGVADVLYYIVHYQELRDIIQWKVWHQPVHERDEEKESVTLRKCFHFLDLTSRSFSAVIQELHPELLVPIALFYLTLRGLDTIEDDMTIALEEKDPLLRHFDENLEKDGWTYNGNGPEEKDRQLLVEFNNVVEEFKKIKPAYRTIIKDITHKMGNGMADFCANAVNSIGVNTVEDYNLYCHYVAGLVGEGLTRLFVESELANPALLQRPHLQESMGLFLQKTNIIRDVKEDWEDNRIFYPREIWSKHVDKFEDLFEKENQEAALNCSSEMVLNALTHADECIFYLAGLKEQSVFNFAAIPQSMAIATLELVFRNPAIFQRNIKIKRGDACRIMMQSTQNLQVVCEVFRTFARKIHKKNTPKDPNFLKISIACGRIEQFIESIFPSQSPEAIVQQQASEVQQTSQVQETSQVQPADAAKAKAAEEAKWDTIYMLAAVMGTLFLLSCIMIFVAYLMGARFDVTVDQIRKGRLSKPQPAQADEILRKYDHGEL